MLEEGVGDQCHERMTMKADPRSSLEVIEAEFLFQLLKGLLADPSRLAWAYQVTSGTDTLATAKLTPLIEGKRFIRGVPRRGPVRREALLRGWRSSAREVPVGPRTRGQWRSRSGVTPSKARAPSNTVEPSQSPWVRGPMIGTLPSCHCLGRMSMSANG